jgi:beta-1,4-N-acetylglucosaminyltransferase
MKIAVICSPGGHLAQSLAVLKAFHGHEIILISYRFPNLIGFRDDRFRKVYLLTFLGEKKVKLSLTLFLALFSLMGIFLKEKPDVVFSTGSEIAIGAFLIGKLFFRTKLIFLETASRVLKPSLTGRILYPISDLFLVQWPTLLKRFGGKAQYRGCVYDLCNSRE